MVIEAVGVSEIIHGRGNNKHSPNQRATPVKSEPQQMLLRQKSEKEPEKDKLETQGTISV